MSQAKEPKTLQEAIIYFADANRCLDYLALRRWPDGVPVCPVCGRRDARFLANQRKWQCKSVHHHRQFSVKVGSIFEDSPIPLEKWLPAVWVIVNCKNGISSYELARDLGVTQKSAWFMLHRIRKAMQTGTFFKKLGSDGGEVEVDETFIGGKARNMHLNKRQRRITGTGGKDKAVVFGVLERGKEIRTVVVVDRKKETVQPLIKDHVVAGTALYSDDMLGYRGLESEFAHKVVDHAVQYVDGKVHTNGLENFWSLLKRSIAGTYVSVEPFHLHRYLDEQTFRYNNRGNRDNPITDADRFSMVLSQTAGRRLTFAEVTGKTGEERF
jgi:transposase-like protein